MKTKFLIMSIMVVLVTLMVISVTLAANWVYLENTSDWVTYYVDADSVIKTNSGIVFWAEAKWNHASVYDPKRTVELHEVKILNSARWDRIVEQYDYGFDNKLIRHFYGYEDSFCSMRPGSDEGKLIEEALKYAKPRPGKTSFGTNWFFIDDESSSDKMKSGMYSIDYDSIIRKGDTLTFRYKIRPHSGFVNNEGIAVNYSICVYSANLANGIGATLERHVFDGFKKDRTPNSKPEPVSPYQGTIFEKLIQFALQKPASQK